jgi:hypothetical protein
MIFHWFSFLIFGLGSNIGHGLFIGWVESAGGLGFSASGPTYLPAIFVLSAKPNKIAALAAGGRTISINPGNSYWIPASAGMTIGCKCPSFPRRRESSD